MFFKKYEFGDIAVYYIETPVEGTPYNTVGLAVYPSDVDIDPKKLHCDSMVQVAFQGDIPLVDHTYGMTMRNRASVALKAVRQAQFSGGLLNTYLTDGHGNDFVHRLAYDRRTGVLAVNVRYENHTGAPRTLEYLASASLSGIASPSTWSTRGLLLHRMTSAWSRECRLKTDSFSALGMDMSWARFVPKVEKWGQCGSTPNRGYYPFAAVEDPTSGITWGMMQEAPYSWEIELYEEKETCSLTGGLAGFETGHWRRTIPANGTFTTYSARFAVKRGGVNAVCNALVHEMDHRLRVPESEDDMPVLYNEYCASWGKPTAENVEKRLPLLEGLGIRYFVIDCGWYKPLDKDWTTSMGDWNVNKEYFPDLRSTVKKIGEHGMKAGIWFECEIAGKDSVLFAYEDQLLKRDGVPVQSKNRRFLDLRREDVREYLHFKLNDFLRENGFRYLKIDYNDNYGIGCDGAESLGEGGRQVAEASLALLDELKAEIPDLVLENCSSGGSRIEPCRMAKVSMASFSDAHECPEIPLVAANVSRVIPARQSQIWAVIRRGESDSRTIYSLCAAMMGRICLSGDISCRKKEKFALIKEGLSFYEEAKDIVRRGDIILLDNTVEFYRDPVGRQLYVKEADGRRLVLFHNLEGSHTVEYPLEGYVLKRAFTDLPYTAEENVLRIEGEPYRAGAFLLERE